MNPIAAGMRTVVRRAALGAPARVFVVEGEGAPAALRYLALCGDVELVESPRSATVLLVAGTLPNVLDEPVARVHDRMPHPRATVRWPHGAEDVSVDSMAHALSRVQTELVSGARPTEPDQLPNEDPAPWRGVGPFGQGGAGMTGGVPYGRPMAGRAPDRDGLELDQLPVRVGPWFTPLPSGLVLDVRLQGDVVQELTVPGNAFAKPWSAPSPPAPVPIAELERARASHHLCWLAHVLRVHGLAAIGRRSLALAREVERGDAADTRVLELASLLERMLSRHGTLGWATRHVGALSDEQVRGKRLGPVTRACGIAEDARVDDPAYRALGFEPVVQASSNGAGDARARWRQRIGEVRQSVDLARRAGERRAGEGGAAVEGFRGRIGDDGRAPSAALLDVLPGIARGQDWGDAVTTIVSLDIDVGEAAYGAQPLTPQAPPPAPTGMTGMGGGGMGGTEGGAHADHEMAGMAS